MLEQTWLYVYITLLPVAPQYLLHTQLLFVTHVPILAASDVLYNTTLGN
jgi:hypothetical protein